MLPGSDCTLDELVSVCISRQVENGEVVAQGLATPLVACGYLLAWHTHAPDIYFASAIGQTVCRDGGPIGLASIESIWLDKAMNTYGFVQAAADLLPRVRPKEFFRPGQVDAQGNFNNISIGSSYRRPRLRLPGSGGIPDVTPVMDDIHLYVPRHSRVTFVERLDFLSGMGHHHQRLRGAGPRYLVSDLGQFDFAEGKLRLTHLHPGVELGRVIAKTGFPLQIADQLQVTEPPSDEEIQLLRREIDPLGLRCLEFLSGAPRRAKLREIIAMEKTGLLVPSTSGTLV